MIGDEKRREPWGMASYSIDAMRHVEVSD